MISEERLRIAMLTEKQPALPLIDERRWAKTLGYAALTFAVSFNAFVVQREDLLRTLRGLDTDAWERTGNIEGRNHSVFSQTRRMALHEIEHFSQFQALVDKLNLNSNYKRGTMTDNILIWSKSIITTSPARWSSLVQSVPLELLSMRPAPNEWSAIECLQHVADVERVSFPMRIKALMTGQPFTSFNPQDRPPKPPPTIALADEFNQLRQQTLVLFNQITEADLDNQALHAEYGMVSLRQFVHHMAGHDLNHLVQAEWALMQPFIRGCGPWVVNYDDHIVKVD
jgi:hypothetical protein